MPLFLMKSSNCRSNRDVDESLWLALETKSIFLYKFQRHRTALFFDQCDFCNFQNVGGFCTVDLNDFRIAKGTGSLVYDSAESFAGF